MFSYSELKTVQIEITNRCQASCPMCPRNIHGGIDNPLLKINDWTIDDFTNIFNLKVLAQIEHIIFCGDFGDPLLNNDLILMCRYLKENSDVFISIHTNGSARSATWWKELAEALPTKHKVHFALDGLEDTHHIYRIGTKYDIIIKNAKAFIDAGGYAEWVFIEFKHNQHQIDQAEQISKAVGFKSFKSKTSKRFGKSFPVLSDKGEVVYQLEQNTRRTVHSVEIKDLENYKEWKNAKDINCFAVNDKELYIDAHFTVMPCCMTAAFLYTNYDTDLYNRYSLVDSTSILDLGKQIQDEVLSLVDELGGFEQLNARLQGIETIMNHESWQTLVKQKWQSKTSSPCIILCSKDSPYIRTDDQWN